jgi:hypothetical protein
MESDPAITNGQFAQFALIANTDVRFISSVRGTGSFVPLTYYTGNSERMRIDTGGNVGIGTSTPFSRLDINDQSRARWYLETAGLVNIEYTNAGANTYVTHRMQASEHQFYTGGSERMRIASDGTMTLNIGGVSNTHQFNYNESGGEIQLIDSTGAGPILIDNVSGLARVYKVGTGAMSIGTTGTNYLQFITNSSEGMRIISGGNVGIGNTAPAHKLSVTGTAAISSSLQVANITTGANTTAGTITGNWSLTAGSRLTATYADIAEKYVADDTYEPGTVLLFGGEQEVTLSNAFDSTKVAGVVTTNPAYSMNSALEAEHVAEIALQGRVPCKVIGSVEKGDLMVSASNGHATANNEARAGTIIGKALENFNGDFGIIEVAVGRF